MLYDRLSCDTDHDERAWGIIRSTAPSRTNTATWLKGCSSDSGTRSRLRRSPRRGGLNSYMTSSFEGLVTFGELVPSQLPWFAGSRDLMVNNYSLRARIYWDSSNKALDLSWWGSSEDGTKVC